MHFGGFVFFSCDHTPTINFGFKVIVNYFIVVTSLCTTVKCSTILCFDRLYNLCAKKRSFFDQKQAYQGTEMTQNLCASKWVRLHPQQILLGGGRLGLDGEFNIGPPPPLGLILGLLGLFRLRLLEGQFGFGQCCKDVFFFKPKTLNSLFGRGQFLELLFFLDKIFRYFFRFSFDSNFEKNGQKTMGI